MKTCKGIAICCLAIFLILSCSSPNERKHDIIEVDLSNAQDVRIDEIFDSIHFVPLQTESLFRTNPLRFQFRENRIGFLHNDYGEDGEISIFSIDGNLTHSWSSSELEHIGINSLNDFFISKDHISLLHDDKITQLKYTNGVQVVNKFEANSLFQNFYETDKDYHLYSAKQKYSINSINKNSLRRNESLERSRLPTGLLDLFKHFTSSHDYMNVLFFQDFDSNVYMKNSNKDGEFVPFMKYEFKNQQLSESEIHQLIGDIVRGEMMFDLCKERVCRFEHFYDLKNYQILILKVLNKVFFVLYNKSNQKILVVDKFINNSGIDFITVYDRLNIYDAFHDDTGDYIVCIIDSEYAGAYNTNQISPLINSNWEDIKDKVHSDSNPIIALLKVKNNLMSQ